MEQVQSAIALGADYMGCGPTFTSSTKHFASFPGVSFLKQVQPLLEESNIPAFAIGGIHAGNIQEIVHAGFHRVAVSSAIWNAEKPTEASKRLKAALN
jgi:thiamine-phosphate pyrophosphorylase